MKVIDKFIKDLTTREKVFFAGVPIYKGSTGEIRYYPIRYTLGHQSINEHQRKYIAMSIFDAMVANTEPLHAIHYSGQLIDSDDFSDVCKLSTDDLLELTVWYVNEINRNLKE